jgi:DNA-binding NtrC family response regulator
MSNTDTAIRETVEAFVEQLTALIRGAALESVQEVLNGGGAPATRRGPKPGRAAAKPVSTRRQKGAKRAPEELEALVKKLHAYVTKNPGQRIEQVGQALGIATKELSLPVKKLVAEKRLTTKGHKRATTYFGK